MVFSTKLLLAMSQESEIVQVTNTPKGWATPKGHSLASLRHLQRVSLVFSYESFKHGLLSLSADEQDTLTLGGTNKNTTPQKNAQSAQIQRKNTVLMGLEYQ